MKSKLAAFVYVFAFLVAPAMAAAQNAGSRNSGSSVLSHSDDDDPIGGFNAYEVFRGLATSSGTLLKLDSSVGYDFNQNFGVFIGAPLYFSSSSGVSSSATPRASGLGDAYVGAEFYSFSRVLRYSTSLTVGLPTGNIGKGFGAGKVTADWTNRFAHSFGPLSPSFSIGVGNTAGAAIGGLTSAELLNRSLTSSATFAHMEEGAEYELTPRVYLGGAGYHIVPLGTHVSADESGSIISDTVRENGVDLWLGFEPNSFISPEIGYSRSITFGLNSLSFRIGVDVGRMLKQRRSDSRVQ